MRARCVRSWSSYGLKQALPWHVFLFPFVYINLCLPVHETHNYFQGWNTTTTTSFSSFFVPFFSFLIIIIMYSSCFKPIISWHRIMLIVCTIQIRTGECCLGVHRIRSWSCYVLKRGILWQFGFSLSLFLMIWCHPVYEDHKYVQSWNPTTTTSFPGIYNNNYNNSVNKTNKSRGGNKIGCGGVIPNLNMFIVFVNRKILN